MLRPPVKDLLNHLTNRGEVLQCLNEGTSDSREIADRIDKSRSSVDRDIRLLKDGDYIREHPDGYTLTKYGESALDIYQSADHLGSAKQVVQHLPPDAPFTLIRDADIRETGGTLPQRPIDHVVDLVEEARQARILAPVLIPPITERVFERVQTENLTVDLVASSDVVDELWSTYSDEIHAYLKSENGTLWKTDDDLSFGLVLTDDRTTCVGVFDESMRLVGTITNRSDGTVEWALDTFDDYRTRSQELFLRGATRRGGGEDDDLSSDRTEHRRSAGRFGQRTTVNVLL